MKTLDDLVNGLAGKTDLQQAELFGSEVQLVGELTQVTTDYLACVRTESPGPLMLVTHEGELLKQQLLKYSVGDGVRMIAKFTGHSSDPDCYHFALVSIVRAYARDSNEKEKHEVEAKRSSGCFVTTAAYGSHSPTVLMLVEYRDRILTKGSIGRAAIRFYYAVSPPLARFIAPSNRRRLCARLFIRPAVIIARWHLELSRKNEPPPTHHGANSMSKTAECGHGYDEYEPLDEFRDPISGHFYFTYKCLKCGDIYGVWEDTGTPERPPYFGNYDSKVEEIFKDEDAKFDQTCRLIVPDFNQISLELIEHFISHPQDLHYLEWRKFEELLNAIFKNQGFHTELGPGSGDEGVDLRLVQKDSIGEFVTLVQAKRYKQGNPIGLEAVAALYATVEDQKANRGLFVTTSRYLPVAMRFAEKQSRRLVLAASAEIVEWCKSISERQRQRS